MTKCILTSVIAVLAAIAIASPAPGATATAPTTQSIDELVIEPGFNGGQANMLRLYRAFFDREPDPEGAVYWLETARSGASLDVIAASFAESIEFTSRYGATSNEQFLDIVYRNVLGRDYDRAGFQYWLAKLSSGLSRGGTVRWVAANDEFVAKHPYPKTALTVASVTDGDSLVLSDGRRVRLAQVDGPEYSECFSSEATTYLRAAVGGRDVFLRRPPAAPVFDTYGRTVAEVLIMSSDTLISVNESIIRDGYGEYNESYAWEDPKLATRLAAAELEAKSAGRGLWSGCSANPQQVPSQPSPTQPLPVTPTIPAGNCHPAYTPCVPPGPPDLDCVDVGREVRVNHTFGDPHRLDGDNDGRGCESYR